jgi:D-arginine dehydrogenase
VPLLAGVSFDAALWTPEDGVLDVHEMHQALLAGIRDAGGEIVTARRATRILVGDAGVEGVETREGRLLAPLVVNAAGPWAEELAATAGARPLGLRPCRRHLLQTEPEATVDPAWPVVWDVSEWIYLRPESGGLLLCPCDEDLLEPGDCAVDPRTVERGVEKLVHHVPGLGELRIARAWAGLRTLTPDGACVVGPDPEIEGLAWVAGLGGHGISAAGGLLRVVPEILLDRSSRVPNIDEVEPLRLHSVRRS